MQEINEFLEGILQAKGITDVEPDIREQVKDDMRQQLLRQIDREAVMRLPEEKAKELADKMDDPNFDNEQMTKFMQDSGVNLVEVAIDTMAKFRGFYLGNEG